MEKNLTTGNIFKTMLSFSLPFMLSYFFQKLYGMADLLIIGQFYGVDYTTAVSVGSQIMNFFTAVIVGLAMGSTVMIGKFIGAEKLEKASEAIGNTITFFMSLSIVLMIVLIILVRPIVSLVSTPEEAVSGTITYLLICFIGIPFITAYNIISSIFRSLGDSKSPMYFIAVACAANIALDYFFIGYMHLGTAGAALGTTLSQTISVFISLLMMKKKQTGLKMQKIHFRPQSSIIRQLLKVGIPVACQDGFIQISFIIITVIANQRGLNDAAAVGIVEKIMCFFFLVPSAMLSTTSTMCAQNIGAGKHDRAAATLRYAISICLVFGIVSCLVIQFTAAPLVSLFTDSEAVTTLGSQYLRGYIWDCLLGGIHFSFSGYFCAYGLSKFSFLHNSISVITARIPLAYLTSKAFPDTLFPMGFAATTGSLVSAIICIILYTWMKRKGKLNGKK